jgi:hypothetical protein
MQVSAQWAAAARHAPCVSRETDGQKKVKKIKSKKDIK